MRSTSERQSSKEHGARWHVPKEHPVIFEDAGGFPIYLLHSGKLEHFAFCSNNLGSAPRALLRLHQHLYHHAYVLRWR